MDMPVEGVFHNLVIAKIKKDYSGQGQKVMNAMWGAGQMMFNKILVLASPNPSEGGASEKSLQITDYLKLAQTVFKNLNPATDIYFSQGPMDVLDHSCSKLGFGGKMCIDGTYKFEEELDENYELRAVSYELNENKLKETFAEIHHVNTSLLKKEIPCLIISVMKNRMGHIKELHEQISSLNEITGVKMILYVEHTVDANDLPTALWRFCNNLDPKRDSHISKQPSRSSQLTGRSLYSACIGFDGTRKTKEFDDFNRDWPNIIVADSPTIMAVDTKWNDLGIGNFIASPSLKFKDQLYGEEAVVSESTQTIKV
jgi:4-hydroxy-3-polyprenylbenzoate decarboxylase